MKQLQKSKQLALNKALHDRFIAFLYVVSKNLNVFVWLSSEVVTKMVGSAQHK